MDWGWSRGIYGTGLFVSHLLSSGEGGMRTGNSGIVRAISSLSEWPEIYGQYAKLRISFRVKGITYRGSRKGPLVFIQCMDRARNYFSVVLWGTNWEKRRKIIRQALRERLVLRGTLQVPAPDCSSFTLWDDLVARKKKGRGA